jgi:hypothetical protein
VKESFLSVIECTDVKEIEIHAAEPLVSEPSAFQVEMANEKLRRQITWY